MKVFLAAVLFIGIGVFAMCFNIIFLKKDFPDSDVGTNENMKKLGIKCMRKEDDERFARKSSKRKGAVCDGEFTEACTGCGLYVFEKNKRL